MKMPFGKHHDQEIHTIPKDYLMWVKNNVTNLGPHLRLAIDLGLEGKPYTPPTREQRIDEAKQDMISRLKARDAGRTLFKVVS